MLQIYNGILLKMVNKVVNISVDNVDKSFFDIKWDLHNILPKFLKKSFGDNLSDLYTVIVIGLKCGFFV